MERHNKYKFYTNPKDMIPIVVVGIIVFVIFFFGAYKNIRRQKKERVENERKYIKDMIDHGIKNIAYVFDYTYRFDIKNDYAESWINIKKLYVNGIRVHPDSMYRYESIIYPKCDKFFILKGTYDNNIDSVYYELVPRKRKKEYDKNGRLVLNISQSLYVLADWIQYYKKRRPIDCDKLKKK
ncbi:MAG TPA: hypothetical protein ENK91_04865 [Bacteroidetes bacterium]|nr:hypothetical protein [Bacteroidota bacterium]